MRDWTMVGLSAKTIAASALIIVGGLGVLWQATSTRALESNTASFASPTVSYNTTQTTSNGATVGKTVQVTDGIVWAQTLVGDIVYATGCFNRAVDIDGTTFTRKNLLAYNINTGALVREFDHNLGGTGDAECLVPKGSYPTLGGRAIAASPDGTKLFVGGHFTFAPSAPGDTTVHQRFIALDIRTPAGSILPGYPAPNNTVRAIVASNQRVYLGGDFTAVGGQSRGLLASYDTATGSLNSWTPRADKTVHAMTFTPDKSNVVVGGVLTALAPSGTQTFEKYNGLGPISAATGALVPWSSQPTSPNALPFAFDGGDQGRYVSALTSDSNYIYMGGVIYSAAQNAKSFEGTAALDPATGKLIWLNNCKGDTYSLYSTGSILYVATHMHDCSAIGGYRQQNPNTNSYMIAVSTLLEGNQNVYSMPYGNGPNVRKQPWDYVGYPATTLYNWMPQFSNEYCTSSYSGSCQNAWSIVGNGSYLAVAGEFARVNGVTQKGIVRFANKSIGPNTAGPSEFRHGITQTGVSSSGTNTLTIPTTSDPDDETLSYDIYRGSTRIATGIKKTTHPWETPAFTYTDSGLQPGSYYTYRVVATDPFGNSISTASMPAKPTVGFTPLQKTIADVDTRTTNTPLVNKSTRDYQITGAYGVPASGVTAVEVNLTIATATTSTYLSIGAADDRIMSSTLTPAFSHLNTIPGKVANNFATISLSSTGALRIFNASGTTHFLFTVVGYYQANKGYVPVYGTGGRVYDSRTTGSTPLPAMGSLTVTLPCVNQYSAARLMMTAITPAANGWIGVKYPGSAQSASVVNYNTGETTTKSFVVPLQLTNARCPAVTLYNYSSQPLHFVLEDDGGFVDPALSSATNRLYSGNITALPYPVRQYDSRRTAEANYFVPTKTLRGGSSSALTVPIVWPAVLSADKSSQMVPPTAQMALVNITTLNSSRSGSWLSAYPSDQPALSVATSLTTIAGRPIANSALVPLSPDGTITLSLSSGETDIIVDILGYVDAL